MPNINEGELYHLVDRSIDMAMTEGKFLFKMYPYLRDNKWTRKQTNSFIESTTASELNHIVIELEEYIKGGDKTLKEAYGHIPKAKARKIKEYLYTILEDAWKYHAEKKPGRKPGSKTRKKVSK